MTTSPTFPDLVKRCRQDRGLTQEQFADLFDGEIGQTQIAKWERGHLKSPPRPGSVAKLSELCSTTPGQLLDAIGYFGAPASSIDMATNQPRRPALRDLSRLAVRLSDRQLRALIAVAKEMTDR